MGPVEVAKHNQTGGEAFSSGELYEIGEHLPNRRTRLKYSVRSSGLARFVGQSPLRCKFRKRLARFFQTRSASKHESQTMSCFENVLSGDFPTLLAKRSHRKSVGLGLLLFLAIYIGTEIVSYVALGALQRRFFFFPAVIAAMADASQTAVSTGDVHGNSEIKWGDYVEVLHPYFGFVADPKNNKSSWDVSDFGFTFNGKTNLITKRAPGRLVVAVFGGSFANGEFGVLKALFKANAAVLKKEICFVNFSAGGYKQPQQLLVLNTMMALGAEFDVVVNIDGFNEVTLPVAENIPGGVNPFFPRGWDRRTADTITQANIRRIGRVEFLKEQRTAWSRTFLSRRLYVSPTLCLIWQFRDRALSRAIYETEDQIRTDRGGANAYTMHGPAYPYADDDKRLFEDLVEMWSNSSVQMNAVCAAAGTRYYHFLQPNQYVPDSKPMESSERAQALRDGHPYERGVLKGYPVLRKAGEELRRKGVRFSDLTQVFAKVAEPVYGDDCCHLNHSGYAIIAQRIYGEIFQPLDDSQKNQRGVNVKASPD